MKESTGKRRKPEKRKERSGTRGREEKENQAEKKILRVGDDFTKISRTISHFVRHTGNFNKKLDKYINRSNEDIVRIPLDSFKKFRYQKIHFLIVQVPYKYFILSHTTWLLAMNN